jgi:hypothetical protein
VGEERGAHPLPQARPVGHVGLEVAPALADEVVADVGGDVAGAGLGGLPRALHAAQRHADLGLARSLRELLERVAVPVAAVEVHDGVDARRVSPEHLLDEADALEEPAPVERGAQPQAVHRVRDRGLGRRLVLRADRLLRADPEPGEALVHPPVQRHCVRAVLAQALQQLDEVGGLEGGRQLGDRPLPAGVVEAGEESVRLHAAAAAVEDLVGDAPQDLDERHLQHGGPGPQLAQSERGHGLIGDEEAREAVRVEAPVAVADELQRHRVDAGAPGELARGELRQLVVVAAGQVARRLAHRGLDDREVVEQPLGGRGRALAAVDVVGEPLVGLPQPRRVVLEAGEEGPRPLAGPARERELGRERLGPLLQPLDAQELAAEGSPGRGGRRTRRPRARARHCRCARPLHSTCHFSGERDTQSSAKRAGGVGRCGALLPGVAARTRQKTAVVRPVSIKPCWMAVPHQRTPGG